MLADLIILALLLVSALIGLKAGFFRMLGRMVLLVLSLAVTLLLLSPLTSLLAKSEYLAPYADTVSQSVLEPLENAAVSIGAAIGSLHLPPFLASLMQAELPPSDTGVAQARPEFSGVLFQFALSAIGFILIFVLVALIIHFASRALNRVADTVPVLSTLNRLGGLILGLIFGLAEISILLLLVGFAAPYLPGVAKWIAESRIAGYFYSTNILFFLL